MKPFKSIDDQLILLESRGMIVHDREKAYNFLLRKNYYNTVNVYGKYYLIQKGQNRYKPGTVFNDICILYDFEKKLRDHMFSVLMTVEANVSSTIAHLFSEKFPTENSYLNIDNFCPTCKNESITNWAYLQNQFSKVHSNSNKDKSKNNSIRHHRDKHGSIPLWVIINELTFGNIVALFRLLDTNLKQTIAQSFEEFLTTSYNQQVHLTPTQMEEYLNALANMRNIVAHDSCLSVYRTYRGKHLSLNNLNKGEYININDRKVKFYDVMLVARFFISKNAHYKFVDNILSEITILEEQISDNNVLPELMDDLGFNFYVL